MNLINKKNQGTQTVEYYTNKMMVRN